MSVLCLTYLIGGAYAVPVEMSGGSTVVRSVDLRAYIDALAGTMALYGTEETTNARRHSALGFLGGAAPKLVDSSMTGHWMLASELWHLVNSGANYLDYYPVGSW
jgi:hypothetical protein